MIAALSALAKDCHRLPSNFVSSAALSIRGEEVVPSYFSSHQPYNYICLKYSTATQLGKAPHTESIIYHVLWKGFHSLLSASQPC